MPKTDSYPFLILEFVPCTNFSLFRYKIANEHREFRNYLIKFLLLPVIMYLLSFDCTYGNSLDKILLDKRVNQ